MDLLWGSLSRFFLDLIVLFLVYRWLVRVRPKRKQRRYRNLLLKGALWLFLVAVVVPRIVGEFYTRARYIPQFLEAQKQRLYYVPLALLPGMTSSRVQIDKYIAESARKYGLPVALVRAVVHVESGFDQYAVSPTGACGLMQVMPSTFFTLRGGSPFNAKANIDAGAKYLSRMQRRFGGNLDLTLAAYNAGPGWVERHRGVPPFRETRQYVRLVRSRYEVYKRAG